MSMTTIEVTLDANTLMRIKHIVLEAGKFVREHFGKVSQAQIEIKDKNSLVSFVDIEAEKLLVSGLSKIIPDTGFITEEKTTEVTNNPLNWIIDPLDGTTNFLKGIPAFSISVALRENDETILGVVYHIMSDDLFYAIKDQGAFLNDQPIHVSENVPFNEAMIATGFPYKKFDPNSQMFSVLHDILSEARGMRRIGSAAIDLAYTAAGIFDGYYEAKLNSWDLAAGILLVEEAGGKVCDFNGKQDMLNSGNIIAGNVEVYQRIVEIIQKRIG